MTRAEKGHPGPGAGQDFGVLALSGIPRPRRDFRKRGKVLAVRAPTNLVAWVEQQAEREHTTVNRYLNRVLEERRNAGPVLPADVMEWLTAQAAANGKPGDWLHALTVTVRDLARTYPHGCRL